MTKSMEWEYYLKRNHKYNFNEFIIWEKFAPLLKDSQCNILSIFTSLKYIS